MFNEFFVYVLSKVSSLQSISELTVTTLDDATELILNSTLSGPSLHEIWTRNASIAMCVQVLRCVHRVLCVSSSLLSIGGSARRLEDRQVLCQGP